MIDGIWCDVPEGENLNEWLNENVSVIIDPNTFEIIGRLRRIDVIERVRKSGRGRGVSRAEIVERFKKMRAGILSTFEILNIVLTRSARSWPLHRNIKIYRNFHTYYVTLLVRRILKK